VIEGAAQPEDLVEDLRWTVAELRRAESELGQQNDELLGLHRAIAAESNRYRMLFDSAPIAYLATNPWGAIVDANDAAARLFEVDRRFLVGKPLLVYVPSEDRRAFRTWLLSMRGEAEPASMLTRLHRRSGVLFDASVRASRRGDEIVWTITDVTAEQQAEEQLWSLNRELEDRIALQAGEIRAVYDQVPLGIAIVDRSGIVHAANRRAQELVRSTADVGLDAIPATREQLERSLRGETVGPSVVRRTIGGEELVYEVTAGPLRDDRLGVVTGSVVTFDDVTARERRQQADRDFVSNAAHQIRTPITALLSAVAALQAGAKDVPAERDRFLHHLEREGNRLARLANALLVLARASRGDAEVDITVVALQPLLSEIVAASNAPVRLSCPGDAAAITNGLLLEQAIQNALENAVAHGRAPIGVAAYRRGRKLVVEISDGGPGMTTAEQRRVLEPFVQGGGAADGFGLGLAIAAAAAHAADVELEIASTPGGGTTVRLVAEGARLRGRT
jgi:PAS domain S-box-containing protein